MCGLPGAGVVITGRSRCPRCGQHCPAYYWVAGGSTADYTFRFTPAGDGPPLSIRVRRLLKFALRGCGLRAVPVLPNDRPDPTPAREGSEDPMSYHVHVDQAGARSVNDDDSDQPQAAECVKVTIGAGTTRTQALRWLGQALREVSESYEPRPEHDQEPAASEAATR